jgi:hypothetical protein
MTIHPGVEEYCFELLPCTSSLDLCNSPSEYNPDFTWFSEVRTCNLIMLNDEVDTDSEFGDLPDLQEVSTQNQNQ